MVYIYLVHATCIHYMGVFTLFRLFVRWYGCLLALVFGFYEFVLLLLPYDHHLFCLFIIIYGVAKTNVYLQIRKEFIKIFFSFFSIFLNSSNSWSKVQNSFK